MNTTIKSTNSGKNQFLNAAYSDLWSLQNYLWAMEGKRPIQNGSFLDLECDNPNGTNVFEITDTDSGAVNFITKSNETIVIKLERDNLNSFEFFLNGTQMNFYNTNNIVNRVIWVLDPSVTEFNAGNRHIIGSLLAPNANIKFTGDGSIDGTTIANSIDGGGTSTELHYVGGFLGGFGNFKPVEPATIEIDVEKVWKDKLGQAVIVDQDVTINLLADGEQIDSVKLGEMNEWKHTFTDLPTVYEITDKNLIEYKVEEVAVEGYKVEITGTQATGFTVTNTEKEEQEPEEPEPEEPEPVDPTPIEPATTQVDVEKIWEGTALELVMINLLADGEEVDTIELSEDNEWKHTFSNLPTVNDIADEKAIEYTVEEIEVGGYEVEITGTQATGFIVTNTEVVEPGPEPIEPTPIEPAKTQVDVKKVWVGDTELTTDAAVTINLLVDGEKVDFIQLSKDNDWNHTFTDLPTVNGIADEKAIVYTVEEVEVEGYITTIIGDQETGFTVINTEKGLEGPDPEEPETPEINPDKPDPVVPDKPETPGEDDDPIIPVDPKDPVDPVDPKDPTEPEEGNPTEPEGESEKPEEPVETPATPINPPRYKPVPEKELPPGITITKEGVVIDENNIPLGQAEIDQLIKEGIIIIDESEIPLGNIEPEEEKPAAEITVAETLPKTGQASRTLFYVLGGLITMLGAFLGKKKTVKQ